MTGAGATAWRQGRLDGRRGPRQLLFGRMYEDAAIESAAFVPGGRIFCIASAGCSAFALAPRHEVVAVDLNPVQIDYIRRRISGAAPCRGAAERGMALGRSFTPLLGWSVSRLRSFLDLEDPPEQIAYWRRHLDTRRFRTAFDGLLSLVALRFHYAPQLLRVLPPGFGRVLRGRMERCFARHPNRANPHLRALLLGEMAVAPVPPQAPEIRLVCSDAAGYLEREAAGGFDGFALSNILDGADESYARRLYAAIRRAAAPGAVVVRRSFAEPRAASANNHAASDRGMLWGVVDVRPVEAL
jgi:hypothetical protein